MKTLANSLKDSPPATYLRPGNHASAIMRAGEEALSSWRGKPAEKYLRLVWPAYYGRQFCCFQAGLRARICSKRVSHPMQLC
jgi:hypothetical protein